MGNRLPTLRYCTCRSGPDTIRLSFAAPMVIPGLNGHVSEEGDLFFVAPPEPAVSAEAKERYAVTLALAYRLSEEHQRFCLVGLERPSPYDIVVKHALAAPPDVEEQLHQLLRQCAADLWHLERTSVPWDPSWPWS